MIDDGALEEKVRAIFPEGVDKGLELIGTSTMKDFLKCLKSGGTGCMSGMLSETWMIFDFVLMEFIPAAVKLIGTWKIVQEQVKLL